MDFEEQEIGAQMIIKIREQLVNMLVNIDPEEYQDFVQYERQHKVLYVMMKKALYSMLQSLLLYYKKF
jgi:uncharacterized protein YfkK (UPF0435 family)